MITPSRTFLLGVLFFSFAPSTPSKADDVEKTFAKAREYTVKIRSSIKTPFSNDSKGTFTGAGFVIDLKRHWIVTNAHVTSRSPAILRVSSIDRDFQSAKPVYIDPYFDLAIVEIADVSHLKQAPLGCTEKPTTGLAVGAFGHPWSFSYTGTKGIISGYTADLKHFGDMLQTDAPINPGNSGGPLIDLKTGQVIGVNTAGLSDAQNMNYAVPVSEVCSIMKLLQSGREATPPEFLFAFFKNNDDVSTLRIAAILPAGKELGAQVGDVVTAVGENHLKVANEPQMLNLLRGETGPVVIYVRRSGAEVKLTGKITPMAAVFSRKGLSFSGLTLRRQYSQELAAIFGSEHILHIDYVDSGSLAESRGVSAGQELVTVNGISVKTVDDVEAILKTLAPGAQVTLGLRFFGTEEGHFFGYRERTVPLEAQTWLTFDDRVVAPGGEGAAPVVAGVVR